ncbi:hypothetical protein ONZ45_g5108 [Pleurotus djamor]|nr:hypothetical protein ONZ45_g5108 [Pleurotus djamor]
MTFKFTTDLEALRKIDQEISEHEAIVITLKKHRNTRIAINQLPIDILRLIFVSFKEEYVIIVSDIPEFPTLVKLSISTNEYSPFTWILALLHKSPNVEEVDVAGVTTLDASDLFHPTRPTSLISLPKLRNIEVSVKRAAAIELFDYTDIPNSARVAVNLATPRVRSKTEKLAVRSGLKSLCIRLANLYYGTSLERMEILMNDNASNCDLNWFSSCSDGPLISVHILTRSVKLSEYFQYFQSRLPIFDVAELTIVDNSTCGTWKSSDIIPSFQDIRVLNFKGCTDITLLHVFTSIGNVDVNDVPNRSLEVLSLVSVDLKSFDKEGSPKHSVCAAFFERRRQVGKPIHKLTIRNCTVSPQCVDSFRGCVEVDWDGVQDMKKNA